MGAPAVLVATAIGVNGVAGRVGDVVRPSGLIAIPCGCLPAARAGDDPTVSTASSTEAVTPVARSRLARSSPWPTVVPEAGHRHATEGRRAHPRNRVTPPRRDDATTAGGHAERVSPVDYYN